MRGLCNITCEVTRDMDKGTTYVSQTHYAEEILRTHNFWNATPCLTPMQPNTRLNKDEFDKNPAPDFHRRYRGIAGSLGYLVTMTRPDLAWAYSELSKYVQFPGKNHSEVKIAFIIARKRNDVVVLFGTLKVQSFMLTEVRDCDLLIVVTSSTFLKRKDMLKESS